MRGERGTGNKEKGAQSALVRYPVGSLMSANYHKCPRKKEIWSNHFLTIAQERKGGGGKGEEKVDAGMH